MERSPNQSMLGIFSDPDAVARAVEGLQTAGVPGTAVEVLTDSPYPEGAFGEDHHRHRLYVFPFVGAACGLAVGLMLTIATQISYPMITGGKPVLSIPPMINVMYEGTMLGAILFTIIGIIFESRLPNLGPAPYDPRITEGYLGVLVTRTEGMASAAERAMRDAGAIDIVGQTGSDRHVAVGVSVTIFLPPSRLVAIGLLIGVVAMGAACGPGPIEVPAGPHFLPGPYPIDVLPEMHYQVSQRLLEPERLMPAPDSVPTTGRRVPVTFEQAATMTNPVPGPAGRERGRQVYAINCAACHGADGRGQSVVAEHFRARGFPPPVDFSSARAQSRTDGQLYWIIVNGMGNMPPFGDLLRDEDVWAAVDAIREVQGR